jgi:hypothetical protein
MTLLEQRLIVLFSQANYPLTSGLPLSYKLILRTPRNNLVR